MRDSGVGFLRRRPWAVAVAIVMAVPLAAGVVAAGIPDPDGSLHACVNLYNGGVRMIDPTATPGQTCNGDEKQVSWSAGTFLVGAGQPTGNDGHNGDMWFDKTNRVLYGPKTTGVWGAAVANFTDPPVLSEWHGIEETVPLPAMSTAGTTASCPAGKKVLGGGVLLELSPGNFGGTSGVFVSVSAPLSATSWHGAMQNQTGNAYTVVVRVVCATA